MIGLLATGKERNENEGSTITDKIKKKDYTNMEIHTKYRKKDYYCNPS